MKFQNRIPHNSNTIAIGALLSVLFLGEHVSWTLLLAALIMAAGCFLTAK